MKQILTVVFLLCVCGVAVSFAADDVVVGSGTTSLSIIPSSTAEGCVVTSIERYNRQFLFETDYEAKSYYLITQNAVVGQGCFEGHHPATISMTAKKLDVKTGKVSKKNVWSFSTKGIQGEQKGNLTSGLYAIHYPGCCGATNTIKYFSLHTGKLIGASSQEPLIIEMPNTRIVRYITVLVDRASDSMGRDKRAATLFYADERGIQQEVALTLPDSAKGSCYGGELTFVGKQKNEHTLQRWKQTVVSGTSLLVSLLCEEEEGGETSIEIPILNDKLALQKATIKGTLKVTLTDSSNAIGKGSKL